MRWRFRTAFLTSSYSSYKQFRSKFVVFWATANFLYAGGILLVSLFPF